MPVLRQWRSGNNQAPEAGVRGRDPPGLERRLRHGHNRYERRETARGKMAAPPTRRLCGALAAHSRLRGSPSISVSEQRAPGLAAVGSIDASRLALKGQIRHTGSVRILSAGYPPSLLWSLGGCIVPATPPEAAPQRRVVTGAHCAANGAAQWRTRKHWPACRRPSGPPVRRASCPRAGSARTIHDHGNPVRGFAVSPKGCTSPSRRRVRRIAA